MKKSIFLSIACLALSFLFFVGVQLTHSNDYEKRDIQMIRIAYMNGSADALRMDMEKIKKIKGSEDLFQREVFNAADHYIKRVEALSEKRVVVTNSQGGTYTYKSARSAKTSKTRLY